MHREWSGDGQQQQNYKDTNILHGAEDIFSWYYL